MSFHHINVWSMTAEVLQLTKKSPVTLTNVPPSQVRLLRPVVADRRILLAALYMPIQTMHVWS